MGVRRAQTVHASPGGESLQEAIEHDFTTQIVPLGKRRPTWHISAFLMSIWAGFSYVFMGFTLNEAGFTLEKAIVIIVLGTAIYWLYGIFAAYIGSRTGQTLSLLTRSVFGVWGSVLLSIIIIITQAGWIGFQGNLTAQILGAVFGWGHILLLGIVITVVMITNNLFGFTGVANFARYVVAPAMFLWLTYLVIKGFTTLGSGVLTAHPKAVAPLGFLPALAFVTGFVMWGEEPDVFRFLKPKFVLGGASYAFALIFGFMLSGVGGWMMAQVVGSSAFGPSIRGITKFSLFGALWLAFIMVMAGQISVNDGNYYSLINAAQNLLGSFRRWKREYTCVAAAAIGGFAAWFVAYEITNGFEKVASFAAIGVPTGTLIIAADHFLVPKIFGISRPLDKVPTWREASRANWPAIIALLVAVGLGGWASGLLPGGAPSVNLGMVPLESWALGVLLYLLGVWITLHLPVDTTAALGFSAPAWADAAAIPAGAVVDVASEEGPDSVLPVLPSDVVGAEAVLGAEATEVSALRTVPAGPVPDVAAGVSAGESR
jgi:purine-cytosine permease-like protein